MQPCRTETTERVCENNEKRLEALDVSMIVNLGETQLWNLAHGRVTP